MSIIKNYLLKVYKVVFNLAGKILTVNPKIIIFESFHGKQFSDSPRAIFEYMLERYPDYEFYWSVNKQYADSFSKYDNIKIINRLSLKWLIKMNRAKYWITNSRLPLWIPKPKGTIYVQTWHGTPLKKLAADMDEVHMPGTNTDKYKQNFLEEASKWDYLVSPNAYSTGIFKRAFGFDKSIIESGYPRNDYLINNNNSKTISNIKEKICLPSNKKIILYAPTWRDNNFYSKGKYRFNLVLDLNSLKNEFDGEYIVLLRLHYLIAENIDLSAFEGFVYDFSKYEDIRDLYLISDFLITDYSSVFFDYANLRRPMLFYVYDIVEYRDKLRGFYFNFEEKAPGPLLKTTQEIINYIKTIEKNGFTPSAATEAFYEKFCYLEHGRSSETVVKEVFNNNSL